MARIRTVKPEFFTSDDVVALSPLARLLYIGLWCEADREGRMVWAPKAFKRRYLPEDACDIDDVCEELRDAGLVVTYGDTLAHIPTFSKHQHVNPREALSTLPDPADHASRTRSDASVTRREEGKEGEGKELKERKDRTRAKARKSTIPDDWKADDDLIAYAREQGCRDPHDTFERFKLHHAGKGTEHKDWSLAAKYWARNEKNFLPSRGPTNPKMQTMAAPQPEDWAWKVKWHREKGMWNVAWGPEPGQPGCFVPKEFLQ